MTPGTDQTEPTSADTKRTLHIRCGSDIREALRVAGFRGEFLEFADPFCQGPVPQLPLSEFITVRASFVSTAYGLDEEEVLTRMDGEYRALSRVKDYEQATLWFEHDAYDQLILAFLLHYFDDIREVLPLELICVDSFPGISNFRGLGQLDPSALRWLWECERRAITEAHCALGRAVWEAYTTADFDRLENLTRGTPPVPCMAEGLKRQLRELPSTRNGLGLTQQLVLETLADYGPSSGGTLFHILMTEREPLPFLGDSMFWHVLDDMGRVRRPLYEIQGGSTTPWRKRVLAITETGKEVLAGAIDYLDLYEAERWVGATNIGAGYSGPRWDPRTEAIIAR